MTLHIPNITDDMSILTAALAYAEAGWYVLPVNLDIDGKHPGSVVGKDWPSKSSRDPQQIVLWFAATSYGIALHCGRSGAVIFDVDEYGNVPVILRPQLNDARYQNSRPDDPNRGSYVFLQPPNRKIGNSLGRLATSPKWGEVRGRNAVFIAAPTPHKVGGTYTWIRTGPIPVLPSEIAELLPDSGTPEDAATDAEVQAFIDQYTTETRPGIVAGRVKGLAAKIEGEEGRHNSTIPFITGALEEARCGYYTAQTAVDAIKPIFINAVIIGEDKRTEKEAENEWAGILAWAVGQAITTDLGPVRARIAQKMPEGVEEVDQINGQKPEAASRPADRGHPRRGTQGIHQMARRRLRHRRPRRPCSPSPPSNTSPTTATSSGCS